MKRGELLLKSVHNLHSTLECKVNIKFSLLYALYVPKVFIRLLADSQKEAVWLFSSFFSLML